jgi:hypothetical protein
MSFFYSKLDYILDKHWIQPEGGQLSTFTEKTLHNKEITTQPGNFSCPIRSRNLPHRGLAGDPATNEGEEQPLSRLLSTIEDQPR